MTVDTSQSLSPVQDLSGKSPGSNQSKKSTVDAAESSSSGPATRVANCPMM